MARLAERSVRLMTPTQFLARLAALVPPPRHPLVRFYGVWAPHSRWRSLVVPAAPEPQRTTCFGAAAPAPSVVAPASATPTVTGAPGNTGDTAPSGALPVINTNAACPSAVAAVAAWVPPLLDLEASSQSAEEELRFRRLSRLAWATLYQRVFDIDPLECPRCAGRMRFVQVIDDPAEARSELRRRNLPTEPPPLARARAPDWRD